MRPRGPLKASLGLLAWAIAWSAPVQADQAVLLPSAAPRIEAAFARAAPEFTLQDAQVQRDRVHGTVCDSQAKCYAFVLTESGNCRAQPAGPWCLQWSGQPPANISKIVAALAVDSPADLWSQRPDSQQSSGIGPDWTAGLWLLAGLGSGAGAGVILRLGLRRRLRRAWTVGVFGLIFAISFSALAWTTLRLGLWDALALAALSTLGLGVVAGPRPPSLRGPAIALATLMLGLGLLEVFCRLILPMPPAFPPPEEASLWLPALDGVLAAGRLHAQSSQAACEFLYPTSTRDPLLARLSRSIPAQRRVVHVGDSLVFGSGVAESERFTTLLEQAQPTVSHVNLGLPGTSIDAQWLALQRVLAAGTVDQVVLYLFVANDFLEIDRPYPCCQDGPLLQAAAGRSLLKRCDPADWRPQHGMWTWFLARSPAPYPLRVWTASSLLARHLCGLQLLISQRLGRYLPLPEEAAAERYQTILGAVSEQLHSQNIALTIVLLPVRSAVRHAGPQGQAQEARTIATHLGLPLLDAWKMFTDSLGDGQETEIFLDDPPGNPHLNAHGHRQLATWLLTQLPVR